MSAYCLASAVDVDLVMVHREIRRRRNELVQEMYMLLRKRDEHDATMLDDSDEAFNCEMDIADE